MIKHSSTVIPLYSGGRNSSLKVFIADKKDWGKVIKYLNSFGDHKEDYFEYDHVSAFACCVEHGGVAHFCIVFTKEGCNINTMSHECTHIKNYIYLSRGIEPDLRNDEPEAYLTGWINETAYKLIKKHLTNGTTKKSGSTKLLQGYIRERRRKRTK